MKKIRPFLQTFSLSLIIFLFMLFVSLKFIDYKQGQWEKDIRSGLMDILVGKKSKIEKSLYSRIYYTKGVASFISLNPDITNKQFNQIAHDFVQDDSIIGTMSISRNCIINAVYPLKNHEEALGLDLLEHPERREIVKKTIETRKTFVAGPVELVEGGMAFISYTPVFDKTKSDTGVFWGMADIVIMVDALFKEAKLKTIDDGFKYALRGYNGKGEEGLVFFGDQQIFKQNSVKISINLPYGNWILAVVPKIGWHRYIDQDIFLKTTLFISSFLISVLLGLFISAMIRLKRSENNLRQISALKDKFISILAHDLRSPLASIKGVTSMLVENYPQLNDQKRIKFISAVDNTADSATNLLDNLLGWARSQQGLLNVNSKQEELKPIVEKEIKQLNTFSKNKEIQIENLIEEDCWVNCDKNLTSAILRNLIANAIKFSHKKSSIQVKNEKIVNLKPEYQRISVTDSGVGIEEAKINELFSGKGNIPTKGTEEEVGSGLGLLICKDFVKIQGGEIFIESIPGKGSTFSFTLPVASNA